MGKRPTLEGFVFGSDDEGEALTAADAVAESGDGVTRAWEDKDDATFEVDLSSKIRLRKLRRTSKETAVGGADYEQRLRDRFLRTHRVAKWVESGAREAQDEGASDSEDAEDVLRTSGRVALKAQGGALPPQELGISRAVDVTKAQKGRAAVQGVQFHPEGDVVMTCGFDKTLRLYHIDNDTNPVVGSYHFENFPMSGAAFTAGGSKCIVTGLSRFLWRFDVESGQVQSIKLAGQSFKRVSSPTSSGPRGLVGVLADQGFACVLDGNTNRVVKTVRMNAESRGLAFHPRKEKTLYTVDKEAHVYEWDMGTGRCVSRFRNDAAVTATALAVSPDGQELAMGTNSGIVDFFDISGPSIGQTAKKSVDNLQTMVTTLRYHPQAELLAAASKFDKKALKMVHVGSKTVFANWPIIKTPMKTPTCVDFSRHGGLMAIGTGTGKVLLYTLHHYRYSPRSPRSKTR